MVDLSIVIVSWNTRELLRECLQSLYRHTTGITFEVFVVDNASSDESVATVREQFPDVNVIANDYNAGFSKANNQAIRVSKGRYVALLNPDTLLIEDVFSPLIRYADKHEKIGAIGPKLLNRDGITIQNICARRLPNLYFEFCRVSGLSAKYPKMFGWEYMSYWDHNSSRYVEGLSGSCMVVKRKVIDSVGLMDESQFMYGDEIDWCKRFIDGRWDIYYYADVSVIHYGGESSNQVLQRVNIELSNAVWYYYRKHKGKIHAFIYCAMIFFLSMSKYIWILLFGNKNSNVEELKAIDKNNFRWSLQKIFGK